MSVGPAVRPAEPPENPIPYCLVSACLCGIPCRYDGRAATVERLAELYRRGLALAVCPEVQGGLPAPRPPCELKDGHALTREGRDLTPQFAAGAARVLELAKSNGIQLAILKDGSPSCGSSVIYDGTFSGRRVPGQGLATALLCAHGVRVVSELEFSEVLPSV